MAVALKNANNAAEKTNRIVQGLMRQLRYDYLDSQNVVTV